MNARFQPSGPNHHFLPRFLQRGFRSRKGGPERVWFFERDGSASEEQIRDIGADEYFYGHPSESPVDEQLKPKEDKFGAVIAELRKMKTSQAVSDRLLPQLFAHMTVRTKNLRENFGNTTAELLNRMAKESDSATGQAHLQRKASAMAEVEVAKLLNQEPVKSRLAAMPPDERKALLEHVYGMARSINVAPMLGPLLRLFGGVMDFSQMAATGHIKALSKLDGGVPPRIDALSPLNWSLIVRPSGTFILGDIAVMAQPEEGCQLQSPLKEKETPYAILLPISDRHLLVGSRNQSNLDIDPEFVNAASAELSIDFFIASQSTDREHNYLSRLGTRADLFTSQEMDEIVTGVLEEF